jgi:hypothetical protein
MNPWFFRSTVRKSLPSRAEVIEMSKKMLAFFVIALVKVTWVFGASINPSRRLSQLSLNASAKKGERFRPLLSMMNWPPIRIWPTRTAKFKCLLLFTVRFGINSNQVGIKKAPTDKPLPSYGSFVGASLISSPECATIANCTILQQPNSHWC